MISRLCGTLLEKLPPALLIDVHGVGYEVFAPMTTFYHLPEVGNEIVLYTHFVVREDVQQLYGFATHRDRELFRTLVKVNGVGPKMALGIMSGMEAADLVRCVQTDNIAALTRIPGVGKKTAERLMIDLRDKLTAGQADSSDMARTSTVPANHAIAEAESALASLGYKPAEASRMIQAARRENTAASSQELIRLALRAAVKV
jgi:Holliday junction DNA helicase RuvA